MNHTAVDGFIHVNLVRPGKLAIVLRFPIIGGGKVYRQIVRNRGVGVNAVWGNLDIIGSRGQANRVVGIVDILAGGSLLVDGPAVLITQG